MTQDRIEPHPAQANLPTDRAAANPATCALAQIIEEYHRGVYQYAFRLCGSAADAEDLTQQTFLLVHQHAAQVREPERLKSWIYSILRNCFLQSHRRRRPVSSTTIDLRMDEIVQPIPEQPLDSQALHCAIQELPDEFRVVVLMYYFEGLSYREIAEALGVPLGTVMSRLSRGKSHLRLRLCLNAESTQSVFPGRRPEVPSVSPNATPSTAGIIHG
ncbi:MAG: polymerase sigma factor SigE [Planctomycetota bacterium]